MVLYGLNESLIILEAQEYRYLIRHPRGHNYLQRIIYVQKYLESQSQTIRIIRVHSSEKISQNPHFILLPPSTISALTPYHENLVVPCVAESEIL